MKKYNITVNGTTYAVEVEEAGGSVAPAPAPVDGANAPFPAQSEGESTDDLPF